MKTDILVIGGGIAARKCAYEAAKHAETLLICDGSGSSPYIHGLNVPLYEEDNVECFIEDTLHSGLYQNNKSLVELMCKESIKLKDEFLFDKSGENYNLLKPLGSTYPRVATINGFAGVSILNDIEKKRNFEELASVRALKLEVKNGKVLGAYCYNKITKKWFFINAKAVVVATGGFCGIYNFSTNSADIGGDGIAMCLEAGATLCDMEFVQFEPSCAVYPPKIRGKSVTTTMLFEGAAIRNGKGERFLKNNECAQKDYMSQLIHDEITNGFQTPHGGVYYDVTGVSKKLLLEKYSHYVKRYFDVGIDISKEYMEIAPAPHTSMGGVCIDEQCRTNIDGLFVCGEASGGIHGANRLGGNAGLEVLVFGKIAGERAAKYAETNDYISDISAEYNNNDYDASVKRIKLKEILDKCLNVVRNGNDLMYGIKSVKQLLSDTEFDFSYDKARLHNDLLCAYAMIISAYERKGSVGAHKRSDSIDEMEKYTIDVVYKNNTLKVVRRSI